MADLTTISRLGESVGSEVTLKGWVTHRRGKGKIAFLVVRDGTGTCQVVASINDVDPETVRRHFVPLSV